MGIMAQRLVTVFGGSGFVGRNIVRQLAQQGWRVRAAVRRPELAQFLQPMGDVGQIVAVQANVRNAASVAAAVAGADAVVNAVGIYFQRGRQRFDIVHSDGAHNIGAAARAAGVRRLVHDSGLGADESDSSSPYVRSKGAAEAATRQAFPGATILRPSVIFGPGDTFFTNLASIARLSPVMPAIGGDHSKFQPVYVGDVAAAVGVCLNDAATAGQTYELGGPNVYTMRQLAELVLAVTARRSKRVVYMPFALTKMMGLAGQFLPRPPITFDQAYMLEKDSVVHAGMPGLAELGIVPSAPEVILPTYLERFRPTGSYSATAA
jgi:NADH dehydrogenase